MARGTKLTTTEKYAIRGMLEEGLSVIKIANLITRSESVVRKYITENLMHIKECMPFMSEEVEKAVIEKLTEAGVELKDALASVNVCKRKLSVEVSMEDLPQLVSYCLKRVNIKGMFLTESQGGRKGIAVMTKGGSEKMDELRAIRRSKQTCESHIYRQEDQLD